MSAIETLVQSFMQGEEPPTEEIGQTFYLTLKGRAQLEALSQVAKRSRTRTGSQILQAALDQAIALLPDEPIIRGKFGFLGEPNEQMYTPAQFIDNTLAQWAEIESLEAQGLLTSEPTYTAVEVEKLNGKKAGKK
jgi:hypothetical protein